VSALVLGLPSKGRLKEQCEAWLARRGIALVHIGGDRGYAARLDGVEGVDLRLLSASDIARGLIAGDLHAGVTGEDLLREATPNLDSLCRIEARLGFGRADVVIAVPDGWIDVNSLADLAEVAADMRRASGQRFRIATKYKQLAASFLSSHGVVDLRIVDSAGATEGAPASGTAEAIVDITTTGSTLSANGLKILPDGLILRSEACLVSSQGAIWDGASHAALQKLIG
jgi:ATP phosphoribosyltransferase